MIGVILDDLFPSEILYQISKLEKYCIFLKNNIPFNSLKNIPIFSINYIHDFSGDMYVFDLNNAELALNVLNNIKVHFFVQDLEWTQGQNNYLKNIKIYNNVHYLYSAEDHRKPIFNYCGRMPELKEK